MHTSFIYNYLKNTVSLYNFKIPLQMLYLKIILLYNIKKKKKQEGRASEVKAKHLGFPRQTCPHVLVLK